MSPSSLEPFDVIQAIHTANKELAEGSLYEFVLQAWRIVLEPWTVFQDNWHIELLCEYLEAVTAGEIRRLIINVPPRSSKSTIVAVCWPCWSWLKNPGSRWLFGSYASTLALKHSLDRRTVLKSDWYRGNWVNRFSLLRDSDSKAEYENNRRGAMVATSVDGSSTGKGGDHLVCDDPLNPKKAASDAERDTANTWFSQTFMTRQNDPATSKVVLVMQRLHEMDTTGMLLAKGGWEHLCVPAIGDQRRVYAFPKTGRTVTIEQEQLVWPSRFTESVLAEMKRELGSYGFAGQYMQNPTPAGGGLLQRAWWCYYREMPPEFDEMLQSWDCAFKDTDGSDYVVGTVWGRVGSQKYLLDLVRGRMDFVGTVQAVRRLSAKWPQALTKLVEDKANGPAVIAYLQREIEGLIAVTPDGGKVVRAYAVSPTIEAGNVFLPDPSLAPWVHDFVEECAGFPNAAHDDMVDSLTQALHRFKLAEYNWSSWEQQAHAQTPEEQWGELVEKWQGNPYDPKPETTAMGW